MTSCGSTSGDQMEVHAEIASSQEENTEANQWAQFDGPESMRVYQHLYDPKKRFVCFHAGIYSNWAKYHMEIDGSEYNCVEQFMMAEKAKTFEDWSTRKKILKASKPREQKKLGREVRGFKKKMWKKVRLKIVVNGCYAKFTQNQNLKEQLLATKDCVLVEASPSDNIWGIGLGEHRKEARSMSTWCGLNLLGIALMIARDRIRKEDQCSSTLKGAQEEQGEQDEEVCEVIDPDEI